MKKSTHTNKNGHKVAAERLMDDIRQSHFWKSLLISTGLHGAVIFLLSLNIIFAMFKYQTLNVKKAYDQLQVANKTEVQEEQKKEKKDLKENNKAKSKASKRSRPKAKARRRPKPKPKSTSPAPKQEKKSNKGADGGMGLDDIDMTLE